MWSRSVRSSAHLRLLGFLKESKKGYGGVLPLKDFLKEALKQCFLDSLKESLRVRYILWFLVLERGLTQVLKGIV